MTAYACKDCDYTTTDGREAMWHTNDTAHTVENVTPEGPAEGPDWNARYKGYAYRQLVNTRDRMAEQLLRDFEANKLSGPDLARAEARLASYNDLVTALNTLKGLLK